MGFYLLVGHTAIWKNDFIARSHVVSRDHRNYSASCVKDRTFLKKEMFGHFSGTVSMLTKWKIGIVEQTECILSIKSSRWLFYGKIRKRKVERGILLIIMQLNYLQLPIFTESEWQLQCVSIMISLLQSFPKLRNLMRFRELNTKFDWFYQFFMLWWYDCRTSVEFSMGLTAVHTRSTKPSNNSKSHETLTWA